MIFERPMQTMSKLASLLLVVAAFAGPGAHTASAQSARSLYTKAIARERAVRDADRDPSLRQLRATIAAYESLVRRYPASAYCDNALWQAANVALLAFERFADPVDQRTGLRLDRKSVV